MSRLRPGREARLFALTLAAGAPAVLLALVLLLTGDFRAKTQWTLGLLVTGSWLLFAAMVRERLVRPLQTLSNMVAAIREGDTSMRVRDADPTDDIGLAFAEANALAEESRERAARQIEAAELLAAVMEEIDLAVLGFDERGRLRLLNRAGSSLLGSASDELAGRSAAELGVAELLDGDSPRTVEPPLGAGGRWELRRAVLWRDGRRLRLVVLADLRRMAREERQGAWRRLVRVLGHEINNSLAPIRSIATTLRREAPEGGDLADGLDIIATRAASLSRFMEAYSRLARLPPPRRRLVEVAAWVERVAGLEPAARLEIDGDPGARVDGDADQLDQLLINLVSNAREALAEAGSEAPIEIAWRRAGAELVLEVRDRGVGPPESDNLFVPFYTTRPRGSGVGLALCRQIAEAHGGGVELEPRPGGGAVARVRLPAPARDHS